MLREYVEKDCGIYKFEDLTDFRENTLVNFFRRCGGRVFYWVSETEYFL